MILGKWTQRIGQSIIVTTLRATVCHLVLFWESENPSVTVNSQLQFPLLQYNDRQG